MRPRAGGRRRPRGGAVIRVLIAEDQSMVRGALRALLELEDDIEVVAEVGRGDEVVAAALEHAPDVALLDIEMPGCDGQEAARALAAAVPRPPAPSSSPRSAGPGSSAAPWRSAPPASSSRTPPWPSWPGPSARSSRGSGSSTATSPPLPWPSAPRRCRPARPDVLREAADGATVAQIARRLFLSEGTVRNYLSSAIGKTGARTRVEAARVAGTSRVLGPMPRSWVLRDDGGRAGRLPRPSMG